jgi:hypothetical protein
MIYEIRVSGVLDQSWSDWLGEVQIVSQVLEDRSTVTTLTGHASDQAALFGILDRIRNLNLGLISMNIAAKEPHPGN